MLQTEKQSFLSNMIGNDSYKNYKKISLWIFLIGTALLIIFGGLSLIFYNSFINWFVQLIMGTSLLFIAYVGAIIVLLDKTVEVQVEESDCYTNSSIPKPFSYKITALWVCFLVLFGITSIYYTNKYRNNYDLESKDCYLDSNKGIYHLYEECEDIKYLLPMAKVHDINKERYNLCPSCKSLSKEYKEIEKERSYNR